MGYKLKISKNENENLYVTVKPIRGSLSSLDIKKYEQITRIKGESKVVGESTAVVFYNVWIEDFGNDILFVSSLSDRNERSSELDVESFIDLTSASEIEDYGENVLSALEYHKSVLEKLIRKSIGLGVA